MSFKGLIIKKSIVVFLVFLFLPFSVFASEPIAELREKAEQGNGAAAYEIGRMYSSGNGVRQDDSEAVFWMALAVSMGHKSVADLDAYGSKLTEEQRDALMQRLTKYKKEHPIAFPPSGKELSPTQQGLMIGLPALGVMSIIALYAGGLYSIRRWIKKHRKIQLPPNLNTQLGTIKNLHYVCVVAFLLPLFHFRIWTLGLAALCLFIVLILQWRLDTALGKLGLNQSNQRGRI